jgi:glyoxylase-like metal-dependent hydrolase (beta-lactamase superfamily II)
VLDLGSAVHVSVDGNKQALLIDTGDIADPKLMPLETLAMSLLPGETGAKLPLLVVHSHGHLDHRAGDPQFEGVNGSRWCARISSTCANISASPNGRTAAHRSISATAS